MSNNLKDDLDSLLQKLAKTLPKHKTMLNECRVELKSKEVANNETDKVSGLIAKIVDTTRNQLLKSIQSISSIKFFTAKYELFSPFDHKKSKKSDNEFTPGKKMGQ